MAGPRYLLDTNILSVLLKNPAGSVADRLRAAGEAAVCTSIVVACELRYGAEKKGSSALSFRVEQLLSAIEVLPLGENADEEYGRLRAALERQGTPIGANDFSLGWYSLNETPGDYAMQDFGIARTRDCLIPFIKAAMKYQPKLGI